MRWESSLQDKHSAQFLILPCIQMRTMLPHSSSNESCVSECLWVSGASFRKHSKLAIDREEGRLLRYKTRYGANTDASLLRGMRTL